MMINCEMHGSKTHLMFVPTVAILELVYGHNKCNIGNWHQVVPHVWVLRCDISLQSLDDIAQCQ